MFIYNKGIILYQFMTDIFKTAKYFEDKLASKNQYVYHIKTKDFEGKYIYPLSELKEIYPKIYKKEIKKYNGREEHPEIKIKFLNCQWKDVISFSTINPIKIFQLEELIGLPGYEHSEECQVLQFNLNDFKDLEYCLYDDNKSPKKEEAYKKVSNYEEIKFVPPETVKYFATCKEKNEHPLIFGNVPHILVKSKINISKAKILNFKTIIE